GVRTNLAMLIHALEGEAFRDFTIDTTSIDREPAAFLPEKAAPDEQLLSAVALTMSASRSKRIQTEKFARDSALDPIWDRGDCWTNAGDNPRRFNVRSDGESHAIPVAADAGLSDLSIISAEEDRVEVWQAGQLLVFEAGQHDDQEDAAGDSGQIMSPMHGRLIAKAAEHDQTVTRGDPVAIVEAMKMEHTIEAARDGTVTWHDFEVGDQVEKGAILAEIVEGVDGD
ncbi:MAG: biotin/lipoyl-containing protein, partial [Pseudomonadota bacterium]